MKSPDPTPSSKEPREATEMDERFPRIIDGNSAASHDLRNLWRFGRKKWAQFRAWAAYGKVSG